ncbi:type II toxin-antitoxin system HicA family toxin [Gemmatimonadota bacterium]
MTRLPVLKPREVVAVLTSLGFEEIRQKGSHKQFRHPDGRRTTVPFHGDRGHLTHSSSQDHQRHRVDC